MKRFITGLFSGDLLLNNKVIKEWKFILYIFILIFLYISKNFGMEKSLLAERTNTRILKNIKADYTSKSARLLYVSKRNEIEKLLTEKNSLLKTSEVKPRVIKLNK